MGLGTADDAAIYRLSESQAIIHTTDFFTPIVDDPYAYGAIAAANALSDLYAMGATPFLALNVANMPPDLPTEILQEIFRGGADKVREAGAVIGGGHTVQTRGSRSGAAGSVDDEERGEAGGRALAHQAARHGGHHHRAEEGRGLGRRCGRCSALDDAAQP